MVSGKARKSREDDPPWLGELILFESEKRRLRNLEDPAPNPEIDPKGDVVSGIPAPSPLLRLLTLRHPVHTSKNGEAEAMCPPKSRLSCFCDATGPDACRRMKSAFSPPDFWQ